MKKCKKSSSVCIPEWFHTGISTKKGEIELTRTRADLDVIREELEIVQCCFVQQNLKIQ